ncbi:hypothetical protein [Micromonospora sp. NPDC047074]|uniref:hypothetical protein n=1 Tax=Micromonospora sp. NPDC047074 TaxID=3154339 RepID=UPI0033EFDE9E
MTGVGSVVRRSWRSFVSQPPPRPAPAGRGREGYRLWQRVWASIINRQLPRLAATTVAPPRVPPAVRRPVAGWFGLPVVPTSGALTAAGDDRLVLEASSPDGGTLFLVRGAAADYQLEVTLLGGGDPGPLAASVRYAAVDGTEWEIVVPMPSGRVGPPAGYVTLPGFGPGSTWAARGPEPVTADPGWSDATVTLSVRAALNDATRQAWRRIGATLGGRLGGLIDEALR